MATKADGIRMALAAIDTYSNQADAFEAEAEALKTAVDACEFRCGQALEALGRGLLPDLEPDTLARAAEISGVALGAPRAELEKRQQRALARIEAIEAEPFFRDRERLIAPGGDFQRRTAEANAAHDAAETALARFSESADFTRLYEAGYHLAERSISGFQGFWRALTFAGTREDRAAARAVEALGVERFDDAVTAHDQAVEARDAALAELEAVGADHRRLDQLIQNHSEATDLVSRWPAPLLEGLQQHLGAGLGSRLDLDKATRVHSQLPRAGRVWLAQAFGEQARAQDLTELSEWCAAQAKDRVKRVQSIHRVRSKWARKPHGLLRGDKRKWLVTVPEMKRASTEKAVRFLQTLRAEISAFNHWATVSALLEAGEIFAIYDLIAATASTRMPYDGFVTTVLPSVRASRAVVSRRGRGFWRGYLVDEGDYDYDMDEWDDEEDGEDGALEAAGAVLAVAAVDEMISDVS